MKTSAYFLLSFILLFTACGGSSTKSDFDSGQFLSIAYAPAANEQPISVEKIVTVTFSAAIDSSTVDETAVYIEDVNKNHLAATVRVSDDRIIIIPTDYFLGDSSYTLVVTTVVVDVDGRTLQDDFIFTFRTSTGSDITAPELLSLTPDANTSAEKEAPVIMVFDEDIASGATLELKDRDTDVVIVGENVTNGNSLYFIPGIYLADDGNYTVTLLGSVKDLADNVYIGQRSWGFSVKPFVDSIAPSALYFTPVDGTLADKATDIIVGFDEVIADNGVSLELRNSDTDTVVPGSMVVNGAMMNLNPGSDLLNDGSYMVTIVGTVQDLSGNDYSGPTSWVFTVNPLVDSTAPALDMLTPLDGSTADEATEIVMAFTETIVDNGVALELTDSGTDSVVNGISEVIGSTLRFTADSDLAAGDYTVRLVGSVQDVVPNIYVGQTSWDFSVEHPGDLTVSKVTGWNQMISIWFSEKLDKSTVSESDFSIDGGSVAISSFSYTDFLKVVTLVVDSDLSGDETISVSGTIRDNNGNYHNDGSAAEYSFDSYINYNNNNDD